MLGGSGRAGEGHSLTPLCYPAGAKRNAPSGPSASSAPSAVTATTGASVRPPPALVSVSLATKALAARSGCALRACMAQAAPRPAPAMSTRPSGRSWGRVSPGQGGRGTNSPSSPIIQAGRDGSGTSAITFTHHFDEKEGKLRPHSHSGPGPRSPACPTQLTASFENVPS